MQTQVFNGLEIQNTDIDIASTRDQKFKIQVVQESNLRTQESKFNLQ